MSQLVTAAVLHQQVPANQIRQTRTILGAVVPDDGATWFGPSQEITDLIKRGAILQGKTHQAGNHIVETDQFRRTVRAFHAKKNFSWLWIVMYGDVERPLIGDSDFLRDVIPAGGEGTARILFVAYIVHAGCKSL